MPTNLVKAIAKNKKVSTTEVEKTWDDILTNIKDVYDDSSDVYAIATKALCDAYDYQSMAEQNGDYAHWNTVAPGWTEDVSHAGASLLSLRTFYEDDQSISEDVATSPCIGAINWSQNSGVASSLDYPSEMMDESIELGVMTAVPAEDYSSQSGMGRGFLREEDDVKALESDLSSLANLLSEDPDEGQVDDVKNKRLSQQQLRTIVNDALKARAKTNSTHVYKPKDNTSNPVTDLFMSVGAAGGFTKAASFTEWLAKNGGLIGEAIHLMAKGLNHISLNDPQITYEDRLKLANIVVLEPVYLAYNNNKELFKYQTNSSVDTTKDLVSDDSLVSQDLDVTSSESDLATNDDSNKVDGIEQLSNTDDKIHTKQLPNKSLIAIEDNKGFSADIKESLPLLNKLLNRLLKEDDNTIDIIDYKSLGITEVEYNDLMQFVSNYQVDSIQMVDDNLFKAVCDITGEEGDCYLCHYTTTQTDNPPMLSDEAVDLTGDLIIDEANKDQQERVNNGEQDKVLPLCDYQDKELAQLGIDTRGMVQEDVDIMKNMLPKPIANENLIKVLNRFSIDDRGIVVDYTDAQGNLVKGFVVPDTQNVDRFKSPTELTEYIAQEIIKNIQSGNSNVDNNSQKFNTQDKDIIDAEVIESLFNNDSLKLNEEIFYGLYTGTTVAPLNSTNWEQITSTLDAKQAWYGNGQSDELEIFQSQLRKHADNPTLAFDGTVPLNKGNDQYSDNVMQPDLAFDLIGGNKLRDDVKPIGYEDGEAIAVESIGGGTTSSNISNPAPAVLSNDRTHKKEQLSRIDKQLSNFNVNTNNAMNFVNKLTEEQTNFIVSFLDENNDYVIIVQYLDRSCSFALSDILEISDDLHDYVSDTLFNLFADLINSEELVLLPDLTEYICDKMHDLSHKEIKESFVQKRNNKLNHRKVLKPKNKLIREAKDDINNILANPLLSQVVVCISSRGSEFGEKFEYLTPEIIAEIARDDVGIENISYNEVTAIFNNVNDLIIAVEDVVTSMPIQNVVDEIQVDIEAANPMDSELTKKGITVESKTLQEGGGAGYDFKNIDLYTPPEVYNKNYSNFKDWMSGDDFISVPVWSADIEGYDWRLSINKDARCYAILKKQDINNAICEELSIDMNELSAKGEDFRLDSVEGVESFVYGRGWVFTPFTEEETYCSIDMNCVYEDDNLPHMLHMIPLKIVGSEMLNDLIQEVFDENDYDEDDYNEDDYNEDDDEYYEESKSKKKIKESKSFLSLSKSKNKLKLVTESKEDLIAEINIQANLIGGSDLLMHLLDITNILGDDLCVIDDEVMDDDAFILSDYENVYMPTSEVFADEMLNALVDNGELVFDVVLDLDDNDLNVNDEYPLVVESKVKTKGGSI